VLLLDQYFRTPPYACDPSSLPMYAPNKEMDAKFREDSRRYSAIAQLVLILVTSLSPVAVMLN
jgi:hypothetical protein